MKTASPRGLAVNWAPGGLAIAVITLATIGSESEAGLLAAASASGVIAAAASRGSRHVENEDGSKETLLSSLAASALPKDTAQPATLEPDQLFKLVVESTSNGMIVVDGTGRVVLFNAGAEKQFGYERAEVLGQPVETLLPAHLRDGHVNLRQGFLRRPSRRPMGRLGSRLQAARKDGSLFDVEIELTPVETDQGPMILCSIIDITAIISAREALSLSEDRLAVALELMGVGTWIWYPDSDRFECDLNLSRLLGGSAPIETGRDEFLARVHPEDSAALRGGLDQAAEDSSDLKIEFRILAENRQEALWVSCLGRFRPGEESEKSLMIGVCFDMTESRKATARFEGQETRLRLLTDQIPAVLWTTDAELHWTSLVGSGARDLGMDRVSVLGRSMYEYFEGYDFDQTPIPSHLRALGGDSVTFEICRRGRVFQAYVEPLRGPQGEVEGTIAVGLDVTSRNRSEQERKRLIRELERRNTELGRFTHTVSHDLRSPLITIKAFLGLAEQQLEEGNQERCIADLRRISNAADRMSNLIDQLLHLAKIGRIVEEPEAIVFGELAQEVLSILEGRLTESEVEVQFVEGAEVSLMGERVRLAQVLQNLLENSLKFMGDEAQPLIQIGARRAGAETLCYIRDNGIGISPRYHDMVFQLFHQLDRRREGTGVGLSLAKRIIEVHGGRIWIQSKGENAGTTVWISLPCGQEEQDDAGITTD